MSDTMKDMHEDGVEMSQPDYFVMSDNELRVWVTQHNGAGGKLFGWTNPVDNPTPPPDHLNDGMGTVCAPYSDYAVWENTAWGISDNSTLLHKLKLTEGVLEQDITDLVKAPAASTYSWYPDRWWEGPVLPSGDKDHVSHSFTEVNFNTQKAPNLPDIWIPATWEPTGRTRCAATITGACIRRISNIPWGYVVVLLWPITSLGGQAYEAKPGLYAGVLRWRAEGGGITVGSVGYQVNEGSSSWEVVGNITALKDIYSGTITDPLDIDGSILTQTPFGYAGGGSNTPILSKEGRWGCPIDAKVYPSKPNTSATTAFICVEPMVVSVDLATGVFTDASDFELFKVRTQNQYGGTSSQGRTWTHTETTTTHWEPSPDPGHEFTRTWITNTDLYAPIDNHAVDGYRMRLWKGFTGDAERYVDYYTRQESRNQHTAFTGYYQHTRSDNGTSWADNYYRYENGSYVTSSLKKLITSSGDILLYSYDTSNVEDYECGNLNAGPWGMPFSWSKTESKSGVGPGGQTVARTLLVFDPQNDFYVYNEQQNSNLAMSLVWDVNLIQVTVGWGGGKEYPLANTTTVTCPPARRVAVNAGVEHVLWQDPNPGTTGVWASGTLVATQNTGGPLQMNIVGNFGNLSSPTDGTPVDYSGSKKLGLCGLPPPAGQIQRVTLGSYYAYLPEAATLLKLFPAAGVETYSVRQLPVYQSAGGGLNIKPWWENQWYTVPYTLSLLSPAPGFRYQVRNNLLVQGTKYYIGPPYWTWVNTQTYADELEPIFGLPGLFVRGVFYGTLV